MRKWVIVFILIFLQMKTIKIEGESQFTNKREVLSYEVLKAKFSQSTLDIEGWGILPSNQHFINNKTHSYEILLKDSHGHTLQYKATQTNVNLSKLMEYRGYKVCGSNEVHKKNCNYRFENVGFKVSIPLSDIKDDERYTVNLRIIAHTSKKTYESALYYPKDYKIDTVHHDRHIELVSHYKQMALTQYYHTLVARTKPEPLTTTLRIGSNCSASHENVAFFKQNSVYNTILDVKKYQGKISYFKVRVADAGCQNNRRRIQESKHANTYAYVPSTYVNYHGEAMKIVSKTLSSTPSISATDQIIKQYEKFNPLFDTKAHDLKDQYIQSKLHVKHNINNRIPGDYLACYSVKNKFNKHANKCIKVTVIKVKTKMRYVDTISLEDLIKKSSLWNQPEFYEILRNVLR